MVTEISEMNESFNERMNRMQQERHQLHYDGQTGTQGEKSGERDEFATEIGGREITSPKQKLQLPPFFCSVTSQACR